MNSVRNVIDFIQLHLLSRYPFIYYLAMDCYCAYLNRLPISRFGRLRLSVQSKAKVAGALGVTRGGPCQHAFMSGSKQWVLI